MAKFKVGEQALLIPKSPNTSLGRQLAKRYGGTSVIINEICIYGKAPDPAVNIASSKQWYVVITVDGEEIYAAEHILQKIPPKREDLGSWDQLEKDVGYKRPQMVTQ